MVINRTPRRIQHFEMLGHRGIYRDGWYKALYRQRYHVQIMFGRLKDWRRIATRYDRCATVFFGAITLAAIFTFWLQE